MKYNSTLSNILFFIFIASASSNSFFYPRGPTEQSETNSPTHLYLDEPFFVCDRDSKCQDVQLRANENAVTTRKSVWVKEFPGSCSEAMQNDKVKDGYYLVKPFNMANSLNVRCIKESGLIKTVFNHNSERTIEVKGYELPASYRHEIKYNNNVEDIIKFVDMAKNCRQFTRIDCYKMALYTTTFYGYLVDRIGQQLDHIGGGPADGRGCQCGINGNCAKAGTLCNCDANDSVQRFDEGYVTDRRRLPITEVRLGDTGDAGEIGKFTIGWLECMD